MTNEAESHAKEDITVPREKAETEKLKADGFSGRSVNPFSKAALRGMELVKQSAISFTQAVAKVSSKINSRMR